MILHSNHLSIQERITIIDLFSHRSILPIMMNPDHVRPTCNHKRGLVTCSDTCHLTKSGKYQSKCKIHLNKAAKVSRRKLIKKKKEKGTFEEEKVRFNITAKLRMAKYRDERRKSIDAIEDITVQSIATSLDNFHDDHKYVLVGDVISNILDSSQVKAKGRVESIPFCK